MRGQLFKVAIRPPAQSQKAEMSGSPKQPSDLLKPPSQFFAGSASWGFHPGTIIVKKGTQFVVTNTAVIPHTFTSHTDIFQFPVGGRVLNFPILDGTFDSPEPDGILPNTSNPLDTSNLNLGTYHYSWQFHDWMTGTVTVTT